MWTPEPGVWTWLIASLLGGLAAVDAASWPQSMVSRPLVSGTVGGALLGHPAAGLVAGAILELLSLRHLPFGAARYPDAGPAGLVAGAAFAGAGQGGPVALAAAAAAGWALGWVGARTVRLQRNLNGRLVADAEALAAEPRRLERRQRLAVGLDFGRGALLTALFVVPAVLFVRVLPSRASGIEAAVAACALTLAIGVGAGAAAGGLVRRGRRWWLLVGGLVLGLLATAAWR